ncbi:MAG: DivIVA domain-containing protein [Eubacterium sp.]|nr:DivIVA domain-containing protein [Eubacterium sp.]
MLTPVDIQQKKFKAGLGYNKDDVSRFFEEVSKSYEELYRSNAELKEKVITLNDALQHYKTTEEQLQKNLMLAEKNSQQSKSNAVKEAKTIELEAKNRANEIVNQAYVDLEEMENKMKMLETRYAEYRSAFAALVRKQYDILDLGDIDPDAKIDVNFVQGGSDNNKKKSGNKRNSPFEGLGADGFDFKFEDDPQMRSGSGLGGGGLGGFGDSGLGGFGDSGLGGGFGDSPFGGSSKTSNSSNVYGSVLGGSGIDPFGDGFDFPPSVGSGADEAAAADKIKPFRTVDERNEEKKAEKRAASFRTAGMQSMKSKTLSFKPANTDYQEELKAAAEQKADEHLRKHSEDYEKETKDSLVGDVEKEKPNKNVRTLGHFEGIAEADEDGFMFL